MEALPRRIDAVEETEITYGFVRLVIIITPGIMRDSVLREPVFSFTRINQLITFRHSFSFIQSVSSTISGNDDVDSIKVK